MNSPDNTLRFEIGLYFKSLFSPRGKEPLYHPSFVNYEEEDDYDFVPVDKCLFHKEEVARYYQSLLECAKRVGEQRPASHVWIRPGFFYGDELVFSFSWFDKLQDSLRLYHELCNSKDEILYSTADQSWYFEISQWENRLLFFESYHDEPPEQSIANFRQKLFIPNRKFFFEMDDDGFVENTWAWENKQNMLKQMEHKIAQAHELISYLKNRLGIDYWSNY